MENFFLYLFFSILSFFIVLIFQKKICNKLLLIDYPNNIRKKHKYPTPLSGGLILLIPILILILFSLNLNFINSNYEVYIYTLSYLFIFVIGLYDDLVAISAFKKLLISSLAIILIFFFRDDLVLYKLVFSNFGTVVFKYPQLAILFTLLCFLLLQNALNMSDGSNGVAILFCIFCFSILFFFQKNYLEKYIIFTIIFYLLILILFNINSKLFLGDNGIHVLSFALFYFIILTYKKNLDFTADKIFLMLMIPGVDMLRLFIFRVISFKNPFSPSLNHLHHYLNSELGWKKTLPIYFSIYFFPNFFFYYKFIDITKAILLSLLFYFVIITKYAIKIRK